MLKTLRFISSGHAHSCFQSHVFCRNQNCPVTAERSRGHVRLIRVTITEDYLTACSRSKSKYLQVMPALLFRIIEWS